MNSDHYSTTTATAAAAATTTITIIAITRTAIHLKNHRNFQYTAECVTQTAS